MKPILFILTVFLGISNVKCQEYEYKTLIDTNFVWSHAFFRLGGPHTPYTYFVRNYFTGGDTLQRARPTHKKVSEMSDKRTK